MLPVQRQTSTQGKKRRSHDAMRPTHGVQCRNCGATKFPHGACPDCGFVRPGVQLKQDKED